MAIPSTKPIEITTAEWCEIMDIPGMRDACGITDESPEEFANTIYGVKFDFVDGSPGYVGDLYILQGRSLTGDPPMVIGRVNGKLTIFSQDDEEYMPHEVPLATDVRILNRDDYTIEGFGGGAFITIKDPPKPRNH
ncbi:MAG: hypothetical protein M3362_01675 [Acidobacteriota bacterium]|nr:hypothetical protein [Acidobacteriota bacterium]